MEENPKKHQPAYIPQIGIPQKEGFQEKNYTKAIYHRATAPGFFGVIILCFFMSFINVKCNGRVVASYTGMEIVRGVDQSSIPHMGSTMVGVRQSAYNQFMIAKENFKWKKSLKDDYDAYIDKAPSLETDFSAIDDFNKMPQNFEDTTTNPKRTRELAAIALMAAMLGLILSLLNGRWGALFQILFGAMGFLSTAFIERYIKVTLPNVSGTGNNFINEYEAPMVTTELALGYWLVLFLFLGVVIVGVLKLRFKKRLNTT